MAFPTGWQRYCEITIPSSKVGSGGVSDFTVQLTREAFPDEMLDPSSANKSQSNGGDVRFSVGIGVSQLACDVINWEHDSSSGAGDAKVEVNVMLPSLSSSVANSFHTLWKGSGSETQPSASDTYGRYNAYESSRAFHLDGQGYNSRSNTIGYSANSVPSFLTSSSTHKPTYKYIDMDAGEYLYDIDSSIYDGANLCFECWMKTTQTTSGTIAFFDKYTTGEGILCCMVDSGVGTNKVPRFDGRTSTSSYKTTLGTTTINDGNWHHLAFVKSGQYWRMYVDGVLETENNYTDASASIANSKQPYIGAYAGSLLYDGQFDDIIFRNTAPSSAYITTRYNNSNDPSTFFTVGTPGDVSAGSSNFTGLINRGLINSGMINRGLIA